MLREKCHFFFCLPITHEDFLNEYLHPTKDFIRLYRKNDPAQAWTNYYDEIVDPYTSFSDYFGRYGLHFTSNGTFAQFTDLVNGQAADVLLFVTHCKDGGCPSESLEFYDRMVTSDELLNTELVPYPLLLDISVCKPLYLKEEMPKFHSSYTPFVSGEGRDLATWLYFYAEIFAKMIDKNTRYLPTFLEVYKKFQPSHGK